MPYIQGENREQLALTPMCLDDYIEADSICRVIAAYVSSLDMLAWDLSARREASSTLGNPEDAKMEH